ncbi:MAG: PAS domain S-box protein [Candidatus Sumerlaeota bacterium]|nr:PAS domain S-box protein [Candidatus Sumerlaeota bacterium]
MRFYPAWSIRNRLLLLVLIAILPALGIILYSGAQRRQAALEDAQDEVMRMVHGLANHQALITFGARQMLMTLAYLPEVKSRDAQACNRLFGEILRHNPQYANIAATAPNGMVFASALPFKPVSFANMKLFQDVVQTKEFSVGEYTLGPISKIPSLHFSYPLVDAQGQLQAIVSVAFRLDQYAQLATSIKMPEGSVIEFSDHKGVRLYRYPLLRQGADAIGKPLMQRVWAQIKSQQEPETVIEKGIDGLRRVYSFVPIHLEESKPPYLYIGVGIPEAQIIHLVNQETWIDIALLGGVAFLALVTAWLVGNWTIVNHLRGLLGASKQVGAGNLQSRTGLPHRSDEIGQLARAFDEMTAALERRELDLRRLNEELEQKVEERTRSLREEISARARLTTAIEQAAESIIITDTQGVILYANPAYEQMTGYSRHEVIGQNTRIVKSGRHDAAVYAQMWETIRNGGVWKGRLINRAKDGHEFHVDAAISPVRDPAGQIVNYIAAQRDVTHEVLLETHLRQAQKMEAVGLLAGGIAHNFGNLLHLILGNTRRAIQLAGDQTGVFESLEQSLKACDRGRDLIYQLLAFSRSREQDLKPFMMEPIVKETLKLLQDILPSHISLVQNLQPDCGMIMGNPSYLHQILMNFFTNAAYAMGVEGGIMSFTLEVVEPTPLLLRVFLPEQTQARQYVHLMVKDTGAGMDAATIERIFNPFFTTKPEGQGSGLGLYTTLGIVKSCGGHITVDSESGHGSAFHVYFPRLDHIREPEALAWEAEARGHERILYVDDEETIVKIDTELLESWGYRISSFINPAEALEHFLKSPDDFDLIIADQLMPNLTGMQLAAHAMSARPDIPVIIVTGNSQAINPQQAKELGIREILLKPILERAFSETIRRVLDESAKQPMEAVERSMA